MNSLINYISNRAHDIFGKEPTVINPEYTHYTMIHFNFYTFIISVTDRGISITILYDDGNESYTHNELVNEINNIYDIVDEYFNEMPPPMYF